jgi:predicted acetyltransferase
MTKNSAEPSALIEVIPAAREQETILANLLQLYAHDFSEFHAVALGEDGRFNYRDLPLYWSEPDRHPFLVRIDGKLAGFVFVKRGSEVSGKQAVWDMAEFFIVRGCRRRGIGTHVAQEVWKQFPGTWEVRVMESNIPACRFWASAVSLFKGGPGHSQPADAMSVEKDGERWKVFSLASPRVA